MGTYYGVKSIEEKGTPVVLFGDKYPNEGYNSNNALIAVACNGIWSVAPDVTNEREFNRWFDDYSKGHWLSFRVYCINKSLLDGCLDEGRVPCGGY